MKLLRNKIPARRLALLRRELGLMQKELAELCGFSTIYILKLEHGERTMTHNAALALSFATGASIEWLKGKGRRYPIVTPSGEPWTTKALEVHPIIWKRSSKGNLEGSLAPETEKRFFDIDYCKGEAMFANAVLATLCDGMAKLIYSAYAKKKTMLVIRLIQEDLIALSKRFRTVDKWPGDKDDGKHLLVPPLEAKMRAIAQHFEKGLEAEFNRRGDEYRAELKRRKARQHPVKGTARSRRSQSR
jgi:transcriptional regulator with XRE-family HTH domain